LVRSRIEIREKFANDEWKKNINGGRKGKKVKKGAVFTWDGKISQRIDPKASRGLRKRGVVREPKR